MIQEFVDRFMANKHVLEEKFRQAHPIEYVDIVRAVMGVITSDKYDDINPSIIHVIDDGDYQGTLLFVIPDRCYQPRNYWAVLVEYGSCSACDTLQGIHHYSSAPPTDGQVAEYMMLALHIVQGLKKI